MVSTKFSGRATAVATATLFLITYSATGSAEVEQHEGMFSGVEVTYRVLLPDDFDANQTYPVVLHFAGGGQTLGIVERSTESDWRAHAEERGIVVISPAAPNGELFFAGGDRIFPAFIEHILATYPAEGDKLHVVGHSNGGLSAFHIASLYPEHFISVTGYPGLIRGMSNTQADAIAPLCVFMHVGGQDPGWLNAMRDQYRVLQERGLNIQFFVEDDQTHRLDTSKDNLGMRLFAELEAARNGC